MIASRAVRLRARARSREREHVLSGAWLWESRMRAAGSRSLLSGAVRAELSGFGSEYESWPPAGSLPG